MPFRKIRRPAHKDELAPAKADGTARGRAPARHTLRHDLDAVSRRTQNAVDQSDRQR